MKLSKRLETISNLIRQNDYPCDVGCDHAYLSIDIASRLNINVIATEIAKGPYEIAKANVLKYKLENKIKLYKTDGLQGIEEPINTIIMAGMGSNTMIHILNNYNLKKIEKIIIQSNKDIDKIREYLNKSNFKINKEYYITDNNKNYITILYEKGQENLSKDEILFGKYDINLINYYRDEYNKYQEILDNLPKTNPSNELLEKINILKQRIK